MQELIRGRLEGLSEPMRQFADQLNAFRISKNNIGNFTKLIVGEMKNLDFDTCAIDRFDNTIGIMKGFKQGQDMALIFPIDYPDPDAPDTKDGVENRYNPGIVTALYTAAVMKRTLLPLVGDLLVCGVPRAECCAFGIKYLFEYTLKERLKNIKGVILCEPTDMNMYLGHKGRLEYEIFVKVRLSEAFRENRGINMLSTMFPLIHELENLSHQLPFNQALGGSSLRIKDVHFCGTQPHTDQNEFKVTVDRSFLQEEQIENILERAKIIAQSAYQKEPSTMVETAVAKENIVTCAGTNVVSEKEIKPWTIDSTHPFVLKSFQALNDNGYKVNTGYWKHAITGGSYTFGELGIPTFGFGPGSEVLQEGPVTDEAFELIKKAVFGQTMVVHRNIGVPTFGWTSDEI
jgi:hypothetical protein